MPLMCVQIIVHYEYKGKHHRQMCYCENTGNMTEIKNICTKGKQLHLQYAYTINNLMASPYYVCALYDYKKYSK